MQILIHFLNRHTLVFYFEQMCEYFHFHLLSFRRVDPELAETINSTLHKRNVSAQWQQFFSASGCKAWVDTGLRSALIP